MIEPMDYNEEPSLTQTEEDGVNVIPYIQNNLPNFDFSTAQQYIEKQLEEYQKDQFLLQSEPKSEFTIESLSMFDSVFKDLTNIDKKTIFKTLEKIKISMEEALSSAIHCAIFEKTVELKLNWPQLASKIGINAPTITSTIGNNGFWRITNPERRRDANDYLNALINKFKENCDKGMIKILREDAVANYNTFLDHYNNRFSETTDNINWINLTTQFSIAEMRTMGYKQPEIDVWILEFTNNLKAMIDSLSDLLIVFALPTAKQYNRHLLREVFSIRDGKMITINVPHFKISLSIYKTEVIPADISAQSSTATKDVTNVEHLSSTAMNNTKGQLSKPIGTLTTTHDKTSQVAVNKPKPKPKEVRAIAVNKPHSITSAPIPKPSATVKFTTNTTDTSSHKKRKDVSDVCWHDKSGCINPDCTKLHTITYTIVCEKSPYKCIGEKCKMIHDTPPNSTTSTTTTIGTSTEVASTQDKTSVKKARMSYLHLGKSKNEVCNTHMSVLLIDNTSSFSIGSNNIVVGSHPKPRWKKRKEKHRIRNITKSKEEIRVNLLRSICNGVMNIGVHVLHDCIISTEERLVLSLGLNFVPPPRKRKLNILSDSIDWFTRRVRIKKHFALISDTEPLITHNSIEALLHARINKTLSFKEAEASFNPTITKSPIESYLTEIKEHLLAEGKEVKPQSHRTKKAWSICYDVINKLKARKDIIIYPADKNLGVTVMNRTWYIAEACGPEYLGNNKIYQKLDKPPQIDLIISELNQICKEQNWLSKHETTKLYKDLISDHTRNKVELCKMYFLPKLHKPTLALRPICSSINWITYWTSVYVHLQLKPLLKLIPSYIANSAQLVTRLDQINPPKYFQFIEADVDNLYPTINIEEAIDTLYIFLTSQSKFTKARIDFIIKLVKWVLNNNYVSFGDTSYLQISGTAMGTPCAVVVACIYMHIIEQEALAIFANQRYIVKSLFAFFRFIDDIFAIVSDYDTGLFLMELLNSRRNTTKLSFKIRNTEAQFLDLTLYKTKDHQLAVRAYSKPMNKFLFLPPSSCHPRHIFKGWIIGYARRLRLNSSDDLDYNKSLNDFKTKLLQRGYSESMINEAVSEIPHRDTIVKSINNKNKPMVPERSIGIPFVLTYSPDISECKERLQQALCYTEAAYADPHFPEIMGSTKRPLISFQRGKNLGELITSSKLS